MRFSLRASRNTDTPPADVAEALLHVAVYAGVPAANSAFSLAKSVLEKDAGDDTPGAQQ